jgi:hypothetical protein
MPRTPIIGGNWERDGDRKMIASLICALDVGEVVDDVETSVCPPGVCCTMYIDYRYSSDADGDCEPCPRGLTSGYCWRRAVDIDQRKPLLRYLPL